MSEPEMTAEKRAEKFLAGFSFGMDGLDRIDFHKALAESYREAEAAARAKAFEEAAKELEALRDEAEEDGEDGDELSTIYDDAAELIRHVANKEPERNEKPEPTEDD